MKKCSSCKEPKPESDFPLNKKNKDGLHCYCKACKHANYLLIKERVFIPNFKKDKRKYILNVALFL